MSDNDTPVQFVKSADEAIRQQALGAATSLVDYQSAGHCLIIGKVEQALEISSQLETLSITVLEIDDALTRPVKQLTDTGIHVYRAPTPSVKGYLGAFEVHIMEAERLHDLGVVRMTPSGHFDLMLDLSPSPVMKSVLAPFGYFHAPDSTAIAEAVEQLPGMVGEFEKPRYFDYSADLCAHSRSKLSGCSACQDVCVTDAISSAGEGVEVNPYLCQGCGTCATVCPSGAMTYAYPRPAEAISRTRDMLVETANLTTTLLLYAASDDDPVDQEFEKSLPPSVMPVAVEEVSAYGIDYWASMLAAGFNRVVVVVNAAKDHPNYQSLVEQSEVIASIISPLGFGRDTVVIISKPLDDVNSVLSSAPEASPERKALPHFATHNNKRQTFRTAIDQLIELHGQVPEPVELPVGGAFGRIEVEQKGCTLCMACVSVCPAGALIDGQGSPRLRFIESNCVQCGLCEQACPEDVLQRKRIFTYDSLVARTTVTLNEEEPFNCVKCNKPFATHKMIDLMSSKLATHWMFKDEKALRRLKMCDDCRVKDMFAEDAKGINVHRDA